MNLTMQAQSRVIALEAHAGEASLKQAVSRLPAFFKNVTHVLKEAFQHPIDALFHGRDLTWASDELKLRPYASMRKMTFSCVPGMKTDYVAYTAELAKDAMFCASVYTDIVQPLITYMARKLSNPEALHSHAPDTILPPGVLKTLDSLNSGYNKVFDAHHDKDQMVYGKMVRRQQDWDTIIANAKSVHRVFTQEDHAQVMGGVERLKALMETFIQRVSHDPELYKLSGPVVSQVTESAYVAATAVEFYGLTYRRALVLETYLDALVNEVKTYVTAA